MSKGTRKRRSGRSVSTILVVAASAIIYWQSRDPGPLPETPIPSPAERESLDDALAAAAGYLIRVCDPDGRFLYRQNLDGFSVSPRYNVLRHAGAIYSLAAYHRHTGDSEAVAPILRAANYLLSRHLGPVQNQSGVSAIWSLPGEETGDEWPEAKLGGTALGLIALVEARRIDAGVVSIETLESLARFILFMQRPSGGFFSRYDRFGGVDRSFVSLYYPGEAILALSMLFEETGDRRWLEAAAKGASFLIRERERLPVERLPADHWLMIASARLQEYLPVPSDPLLSKEALLDHNRRLAHAMLDEQRRAAVGGVLGSFLPDGRSTPTATRLEGLLALYGWLDAEDPLVAAIRRAATAGVAFLRTCQVTSGPGSHPGGT